MVRASRDMHEVKVQLGERSYAIQIGSDLKRDISKKVKELHEEDVKCVVVTDSNVDKIQKDFIEEVFKEVPKFVIPAGESHKNLDYMKGLYDFLAKNDLDRDSVIFALGGGVIGDMTGFAAGTYLRGISYYMVPTTLMGMVDSSVGGKTGINLKSGKNLVGAFHQPLGVYIDTNFLSTLPEEEFNSGMAEVIKYGLLGDAELFEKIEREGRVSHESEKMQSLIRRSCQLKAKIVAEDELENKVHGKRMLLNLGHTFGHAVEAVTDYSRYRHGETVGLGLVMVARLTEMLGNFSSEDVDRIRKVVEANKLPVTLEPTLNYDKLREAMKHDKKVEHGKNIFIALKKIGEAYVEREIDEKWIHVLWREFGAE